jgi:hypothetical protein
MACQLSAEDARQSLHAHVAAKGAEIHAKYGPRIGWKQLNQVLSDRTCVRYPCEIVFDAAALRSGELAYAQPKGNQPEAGFTMHVHPFLMTDLERIAYPVLYQLVVVNYGEFASAEDAEAFGAGALGISKDDYYQTLCELADPIAPEETN